MALVRITWTESTQYVREVEIDGFDEDLSEVRQVMAVRDALTDLTDRTEGADQIPDSTDIEIVEHTVVRSGEATPEIKAAKPAYAEDF